MRTCIIFLLLLLGCSGPMTDQGTDPDGGCPLVEGAAGAPDEGGEAGAPMLPTRKYPDNTHQQWVVDAEFSERELLTIYAAANDWSVVTNGRVQLRFIMALIDEDNANAQYTIFKEELDDDCCAGVTDPTLDRIRIDADDYPDTPCVGRLWHIVAHELGHTFGIIEHSGDGIMSSRLPSCTAAFTESDIELFNKANPE